MVASLLKIISTGMQDERLQPLKGQPDLSAFLKVLIRTGRYATNWTRIDFDTSPDFGKSSIIRLPTKGEMIGRIFLVTNMPDISTIQKTAYYSRKPAFIANSNYTISNQFSGTNYVSSTSYICPISGGNLGIAKFRGIQIDDMSLGDTYTLTAYLAPGATGTISFSILLTDKPLNNDQISLLNKDTYYLVGAGNNLIYSYDGINWADINLVTSFFINSINSISYNKSIYIITGNFRKYREFIRIEGASNIIQPYTSIDGDYSLVSKCIGYNGVIYVCVGAWSENNVHVGSISYSIDGIIWVTAFDPSNVDSVKSNVGNSVVWVESTKRWIATGSWSYNTADPANTVYYMVATSTDGIIWTAQNLNTNDILTQDNTASLYPTGYSIAVNGSSVLIGGIIYKYGSTDGGLLFSTNSGLTWTIIKALSTTYAVAWTGNVWVAAGDYDNASISLSIDGINWNSPINPPNTYGGIGYTIGVNSSDLLIGGRWTLIDGTDGSITKASGNSLDYTWGNMIRPTNISDNSVMVKSIAYDSNSNTYILMGLWKGSTMNLLGTMSISTDGQVWSDPIIPSNQNLTKSYANAAATNGTQWVVVGQWYGANDTSGYTISYSNTLNELSYTGWGFADVNTITGVANDVIYDTSASIFIVVGDWGESGYMQSSGVGNTIFPAGPIYPVDINGSITSGFATSICLTSTPLVYLITGNIYDINNNLFTIAEVTATIDNGIVTFIVTNMFNPDGIDMTQPQEVYGITHSNNGISIAAGRFILLDGSYATIAFIVTKGGSTDSLTPVNPAGVISSPTIVCNSVAWNGTQYVAIGSWNTGTIATSTDGNYWTLPVTPPEAGGSLNLGKKSVWNGSRWVISGNWFDIMGDSIGNIDTFTYGILFSIPINPNGTRKNGSITYSITWDSSNDTWIAAGKWPLSINGVGLFSTSPDGLLWTIPTSIDSLEVENSSISQVVIINGLKFISGSFSYYSISMAKSTDTINWSPIDIANLNGSTVAICWNGRLWVAVSDSGYSKTTSSGNTITGQIIISTDGVNWSDPITPNIPIRPDIEEILRESQGFNDYYYRYILKDVAWNGSYFLAVGSITLQTSFSFNKSFNISQIVYSIDGVTWAVQNMGNATIETTQIIAKSVNWNGNIWVVTGKFNNGSITTSSDGISWSVINTSENIKRPIIGSAWNSSLWVAIYETSPFITVSTDGINWSPAIDPSNGDATQLASISWNGTQFLIVGFNGVDPPSPPQPPAKGVVFTSLDGLNWVYTNTSLPMLKGILTNRTKPITTPELFDNSINTEYRIKPNGYTLSWVRDPNYGSGNQYYSNLTNREPITFTFTASTRAKWLTFGTYYNAQSAVDISLNLIRSGQTPFESDLVGPHFGWTNNLGHSIVDTATISIGGNLVETIPGQLMEILDEFQTPLEKVPAKNKQLCRSDNGFNQTTYGYSNTSQEVITHLPFWFSRGDPGCVLPIDALNVDEVRLTVNFKPLTSVYYTNSRAANPTVNIEGGALWPLLNSQFYYKDPSGIILPNLEPTRVKPIDNPVLPFPNLNMPNTLSLQDTYLLVEYIYLDKAEANRFRIADIQVPIVQHYTIDPVDTNGTTYARIPLDIPNPTRDLFFYCQRYEAPSVNAHFLATRDICMPTDPNPYAIWWPDASGLDDRYYGTLKPGFSRSGSEPIRWLALNYAETLNRYSTENVALFRSMLPAIEQRKAPWVNRYYYNIPFGCQNGLNPISTPLGEANLDKVQRISLSLGFHGKTGEIADAYTERFLVRVYAETYNIFRVYGGRGAMMFAY